MYSYTNGENGVKVGLGATSFVGALIEILINVGIAIELSTIDGDKGTSYTVETMMKTYTIKAPSMIDAEVYVSLVLGEFVTGIWEADFGDESLIFSIKELWEAFRD